MTFRDHVCDPPFTPHDWYCSVCGHRIFATTELTLTSEEIRACAAGLFNYAKATSPTTAATYRQFLFDLALRLADEATQLQARPVTGYNDKETDQEGGNQYDGEGITTPSLRP